MQEIRRVDKVKVFLKEKYPEGIQMFNSRNLVGDTMETIYDEDGIIVDECYYWCYIEIFGVTREEWDELEECCGAGKFSDGEYEGF